jgi:hypothetical protein
VSGSRKILIVSGVALAVWGMGFGLYYAFFVEHQTLDQIGGSLAVSFAEAAGGDLIASRAALQTYADTQFDYLRSVDVHSHWIGLAMLLIIFGVAFDRVRFRENRKLLLAWSFVIGSAAFPLGVILQTLNRGIIPQAVAGIGAALVIIALAIIALGFARTEKNQ